MSEPNTKILVVGATGTVGGPLIRALVAAGRQVKAATREPNRDLGPDVEPVLYDYDEPQTFDAALRGVERIFYLSRAADPQAGDVAKSLFDKAAAVGVKHIVNMSALGVNADDAIPLRKVELVLEASGVPRTLLRPNFFMQNFSTGNYNPMIRQQGGIFLPAADARVSFIDVRDIAAVAAKVLTEDGHAGRAYDLTGGESFSHAELAAVLSKASGKTISYVAISDDDMQAALEGQGMPAYVIDFMRGLYVAMRQGYNAPMTDHVQAVLGTDPRTLSDFAAEYSTSF